MVLFIFRKETEEKAHEKKEDAERGILNSGICILLL